MNYQEWIMPTLCSLLKNSLKPTRFSASGRGLAWGGALLLAAVTATTAVAGDSGVMQAVKPHQYADVRLDTDSFTGSMTVNVAPWDVGKPGELYLVAQYNDVRSYMKTANGWRRWDGTVEDLEPLKSKNLSATEQLAIVTDQALLAGNYRIIAAYSTGGDLVYSRAFDFTVEKADANTLQRFMSPEAMEAYIKEGMQSSEGDSNENSPSFVAFAAADAAGSSLRVSTTNLQETGVDEADSVKTDGNNLFVLNNCDFQSCLDVYALDADKASATRQSSYLLENTTAPDGLYLVNDQPGDDKLITVSGMNQFFAWFDVWGWGGNSTEIEFFSNSPQAGLTSLEKLTLDGALVSSRRVGDTLYVVTRYTPYLEDFNTFPVDDREEVNNKEVLEEATLSELVPQVRDSHKEVQDLVSASECYLPTSAVDKNVNPSIITITGIAVDDPSSFRSVCFLGGSETLYMSTDSLYLATTNWDYQRLAADALVYNPDHTTVVHKFGLADGIAYKGSAEVKGHLGWDEDKKSFRMGENGAYLNVVTSIGDSWGENSSTRLTVLKDTGNGASLETVSVVDGIGKPGEQLYAARFIGDRAYLVTFRVIDPLYVLDLSDQEHPRIAGELEIDGYSDYLHPVSETLLLGIGKDGVADESSFDFGGRGAWYQGVKLSLFDVADPANPREVDSLVLGKRGTESSVLWDHHALSFLPASGSEPARLALPVQLHEDIPQWEGFDARDPSAWYDYTHTALYTFEITDLGISQAGRLISETGNGDDFIISLADDADLGGSLAADDSDSMVTEPSEPVDVPVRLIMPVFNFYSDRSVLLDDAVYYIHDGEVLTSFWGENRDVTAD